MSILHKQRLSIFQLKDAIWLITKPTGIAIYDFDFKKFFECKHHWRLPTPFTAVARIGAVEDYPTFYSGLKAEGIEFIHTPEQYAQCGELPNWYPLIEDLTPKSVWFDGVPTVKAVTDQFDFPLFIKGARQTSKHNKSLSIIENLDHLTMTLMAYQNDPILHWQQLVCREYVKLRSVWAPYADEIPPSYEFRTFWWKRQFVGAGRYWYLAPDYQWTEDEKHNALSVAGEVAKRVDVPFLVVDVAQTENGEWIAIECNDGQESGYAGLSPFVLWRNIAQIETSSV